MVGASMNCWGGALFVAVLEGDRDRSRADEGRLSGGTLDVPAGGGGDFGEVFVIWAEEGWSCCLLIIWSGGLGAGLVIGCWIIVGSLAFVSCAKNRAIVSRQAPGFSGVLSS